MAKRSNQMATEKVVDTILRLDPALAILQRERRNANELLLKEYEKKSPYKDFAQLNRENIIHLIKASQVNPRALAILLFFIENMDRLNAIICSYKVLEEQLGLSQATIARSIKYLKETGFIYVYKSGSANVYVVNDSLVWTSHGDKVQYCKFPANVILSASEQEEIDKNRNLAFTRLKSMDEES